MLLLLTPEESERSLLTRSSMTQPIAALTRAYLNSLLSV